MNQQVSELKHCPFCGCVSVDLERFESDPNWQANYAVVCRDCQASGPLSANDLIAIQAWQNRYQEKQNDTSIPNPE